MRMIKINRDTKALDRRVIVFPTKLNSNGEGQLRTKDKQLFLRDPCSH